MTMTYKLSLNGKFVLLLKKFYKLVFVFLSTLFLMDANICFSQNWAWMKGSNIAAPSPIGVYGTMGVGAAANTPGSRENSVSWTDAAGDLWIFGGYGQPAVLGAAGYLNDLWKFNISTNTWTWMKGTNLTNQFGIYGSKGVASATNNPGGRYQASSWIDGSGNLWLFGGQGYGASGSSGSLNDLWKYNIASGEWTWMKGATVINQLGVYGTLNVSSATNNPGARYFGNTSKDLAGNFYLYSGTGYNSATTGAADLWRYSPVTNEWTWIGGSNVAPAAAVYGTQGVAAVTNNPGSLSGGVSWSDLSGNLWIFGGGATNNLKGALWKYDIATGWWTWMKGSSSLNEAGVYGTQGIAASANVPGGRSLIRAGWTDSAGDLWFFGGQTYSFGLRANNDLWKYNINTNQWTWMKGSNTYGQSGTYGTQGVAAPANKPGARWTSTAITDLNGGLWLFGGNPAFNDLWYMSLCAFPSVPVLSATATTICSGSSTTISITSGSLNGATNWQWYTVSCGGTSAGSGTSITVSPTSTTTYYVRGEGGCVTGATCASITINVNQPSTAPASITSNVAANTVCEGDIISLAVNGGSLGTGASWKWYDANCGGTVVSTGSTFNTNLFSSTTYYARAEGTCNTTACAQLAVTAVPYPVVIAGLDQEICAPATVQLNGSVTGTYTSVVWYTSGDGIFNNGAVLNPVYTPGNNDVATGTVTLTMGTYGVTASCYTYSTLTLKVRSTVPAQPAAISGAPISVCPPLNGVVLTVPNDLNASSYTWSQGNGTTGITFTPPYSGNIQSIDIGTTTNSTYSIRVTANNACGSSLQRSVSIRRSVSTPASITGSTLTCAGQTYSYSTPAVAGADYYYWVAPIGSSINGAGNTYTTSSNSVSVQIPASFTSGILSVSAVVACFSSPAKNINLSSSTLQLGTISGSATGCPGSSQNYVVPSVTGAISYQWTLPSNITGSSTSNNINITFNSGFSSANICVKATSVCGVQTAARCKSIATGLPSTPSAIIGSSNGVCGQIVNYSCPPVSGSTGYVWTLPNGATGSSTSNAISVTYPSVGYSTGALSVQSQNNCGLSLLRTITTKGAPNSPGVITSSPNVWCNNDAGIIFNSSISNVSGSYNLTWHINPPSAATIVSGQNSNNVTVDWNTGNAIISLTSSNGCGNGTKTYNASLTCRQFSEDNSFYSDDFLLYPNPTRDLITLAFSSDDENKYVIKLTDMSGRLLLLEENKTIIGKNSSSINMANFDDGIYFIIIKKEAYEKRYKFLLSK